MIKKNIKCTLFFIFLLSVSMILANPSHIFAVVGKCVNCHTMHNSQNSKDVDPNGPFERLLKAQSCLGCHKSKTTDPFNYDPDGNIAPCVYVVTTDPNNCLAGGNFYFIDDQDNDRLGHNVNVPGIERRIDEILKDQNVPGYVNTWKVSNNRLSCAGSFGCHGTPINKGPNTGDIGLWDGIKGAHHNNATNQIASPDGTTGGGYRFLPGIAGYEDPNWQHPGSVDYENHNEYYGSVSDTPDPKTISALCGRCHGRFHQTGEVTGQTGRSGPWLRHPSDISLPPESDAEYANYNIPYLGARQYSVIAPVARATVPSGPSPTVNPGGETDDIVTCLSCHRAHGSDQPDILRWNYDSMTAGTGADNQGCFTCHTGKDVEPTQ